MNRHIFLAVLAFFVVNQCTAQLSVLPVKLDSLLFGKTDDPFNGSVLVVRGGKTLYAKRIGFAERERKTPFTASSQFVIGAISRQFTAVIVLREIEKGHLKPDEPISKYLPDQLREQAGNVTVQQLLMRTYSGDNMDLIWSSLLSKIAEKASGRSFAALSSELFSKCGMLNTFHPDVHEYKQLVKGYTENKNGRLVAEDKSLKNSAAEGAFISTTGDLVKWNTCLHNGKLLSADTYKRMSDKQLLQPEQTGLAPGFVSMDCYFPASGTSVVVLSNTERAPEDVKKTFQYHTAILELVKGVL
ncbi:serine hydrolase domain-containing protein [Chitinophaga tropicalis]|uniref:Serine hydrolase n=1 Tax=Chitinophaga tropicalis TaxID=2683588 RepID=A0A7K1U271_9BACT|nr:serine hydrolase domain-containing protein [Chitinophaga tropicalis]MVT08457.1 serine hydrolase [Chitinophaga tropicalis]